jgi:hypothetical protein
MLLHYHAAEATTVAEASESAVYCVISTCKEYLFILQLE